MKTRVLVFLGPKDARLEERTVERRSDRELLIENEYSLVSPGTELALYKGTHIGFSDPEITWARYPLDIGYAAVGTVVESDRPEMPTGLRVAHYGAHGDMSVIDPDTLPCVPVPPRIDPEEACYGRFAQIAYSAAAVSRRTHGNVLVFGAGIVGNLAAQWFRERGAAVWIADPSTARLDRSARSGLDRRIAAMSSDYEGIRREVVPDTIVEATGVASVVNDSLELLAPGGELILLGSIRHPVEINAYKMIHRKGTAVVGAHETVLGDRRTEVLADALDRISRGSLRVDALTTHRIAPEDLPATYDRIDADPDTWFGVCVQWR